jgi:hypothetical protein
VHPRTGFRSGAQAHLPLYSTRAQILNAPPPLASNDGFGGSAAMARDGLTLVIGAPGRSSNAGFLYVFGRTPANATYDLLATLAPTERISSMRFGFAVAISADGSFIVGSTNNVGAGSRVHAFRRVNATSWVECGRVWAPQNLFGRTLGISNDGGRLAVANDMSGTGAIHVTEWNSTNFELTATVTPWVESGVTTGFVGWPTVLSGDGTVLAAAGKSRNSSAGGV